MQVWSLDPTIEAWWEMVKVSYPWVGKWYKDAQEKEPKDRSSSYGQIDDGHLGKRGPHLQAQVRHSKGNHIA